MRTAFIETLCDLAEKDKRIWLLTGDLGYSVLEIFRDRFPRRFINAGVAEQNMIGVAAGLALSGRIVFTYSIGNFAFMRCLEQIRDDVCYHNLNVKIVAVGGGLAYSTQGYTHHTLEDIAIMRSLPNMTIIAPNDLVETRLATGAITNQPGPCYLRLGKADASSSSYQEHDFQIDQPRIQRQGTGITLVSTGGTLNKTLEIADILKQQGISAGVLSLPMLKPVNREILLSLLGKTPLIVTIEEHSIMGGLGTIIAEIMVNTNPGKNRLLCFGIDRVSVEKSDDPNFISLYSLDKKVIADCILEKMEKR